MNTKPSLQVAQYVRLRLIRLVRRRFHRGLVATRSSRPTANSTATTTAPRPGTSHRRPRRRPRGRRRAGTPGAPRLRRRWPPTVVRPEGSAAGWRCRPGRRTPPRCRAPPRPRHVPDLQRARQSQHRDRRYDGDVDGLDGDDDGALVDAVRGDSADQQEGHQADAEARRDQRQRRGIVVELDDLKRHHDGPHALGEDRQGHAPRSAGGTRGTGRVRARASRRRCRPAVQCRIACSRVRWSPTDGRRVQRFSGDLCAF